MNIYFVCAGDRPHAEYMAYSFKKHMPDFKLVQFTDPITPQVKHTDEVIRVPYNGHMMLYLMECFASVSSNVPFITTADDVIVNKPFYDQLEGDYDVAIVHRNLGNKWKAKARRDFPYTNGIVVVRHPDFYKECYQTLLSMEHETYGSHLMWNWWGDMRCIHRVIETGKYKIKHLQDELFCNKPVAPVLKGDDTTIMYHFAHDRKDWMRKFEQ